MTPAVTTTLVTTAGVTSPVEPGGERHAGGIEQAASAFVMSLRFRPEDPRHLLSQIVIRLAKEIDDSGALPAAVRELRVLLVQLADVPDQQAGPVDAIRAQRAARRIGRMLTKAS